MSNRIIVTAQIVVKPETAWIYYTDPQHITQWNFAADDWQCPWAENNLTVGGKYAAKMEAKDGSFGFTFEAIYTEIVPERSLQYVMAFKENKEYTEVSISFDAESENAIEMQQAGWQAILNNYKKYCEAN
jgi:uncharacterized protein YndB with AHSA1/START domain